MSDDIVAENVRAFGPIYYAAMFEEMKAFSAADRLVHLFETGALPIKSRSDLVAIVRARIDADSRMSEAERRTLYGRVLGSANTEPRPGSNREFDALWRRLMAAVAAMIEQQAHDKASDTGAVTDDVRHAASALARNLSTHGASLHGVAVEMTTQIDILVRLLSDPQIRAAYGARNLWQVIEAVSKAELGGARNLDRYQSMAMSGRTIIDHLAKGAGVTVDNELIAACETWIAVAGTADGAADNLSKPTWSD
jgi:hypothetical protein